VTATDKSLRFDRGLATPDRRPLVDESLAKSSEPEDQVANKQPALLWERQDAGVGGSETKKDRRSVPERRAEQSDNATYHAMNVKLKLLAYELHAAGQKLTFDLSVANADKTQDKARIEATDARLMATVRRLDDMARETAKQLDELNTAKSEPRLEDGGQHLLAALDEFAPVMAEVDAWETAHKLETPSWEVRGRINGILKLIFPSITPAAIPLTSIEKGRGFMQDESINAHLDAAIIAAESVLSGNRYQADRVVLHAKEVGALLVNHPRVVGPLEPRIKKLIHLADQIFVDNPYLESSFNEALDPIRNVK
jgi:hypothetical protein